MEFGGLATGAQAAGRCGRVRPRSREAGERYENGTAISPRAVSAVPPKRRKASPQPLRPFAMPAFLRPLKTLPTQLAGIPVASAVAEIRATSGGRWGSDASTRSTYVPVLENIRSPQGMTKCGELATVERRFNGAGGNGSGTTAVHLTR